MKGPGSLARLPPSTTLLFSVLLLLLFSGGEIRGAPTVLGPNKCTSCHDHDKQKQWADKDTHTKALEQLEDKEGKAKKYLAVLGLSDPYNLKGPCVACHATIFNGDANAGVSCETCHGPGSAYLEPHQKKGSHKESVSLGLINTRESYTAWANLCIGCHVVTDRKLTAAGHSSGADFELAAKSKKLRDAAPGLRHWEPTYEDAKIAEAGRAAARARGGGVAPPKPEAKPPAPSATRPQPKASPTSPPAARPTLEEKATARPAPTVSPTRPQPKASPTPVPQVRPAVEQKATARPAPTETLAAPPTPRSTAAAPRAALPTPSPAPAASPGIVIVIEVTPVPTAAARAREVPTAAPESIEAAPQAQPTPPSPRPTRRPTHKKPRPRPTARPQPPQPSASPQPQPTPTPTRIKAPTTMSVPH